MMYDHRACEDGRLQSTTSETHLLVKLLQSHLQYHTSHEITTHDITAHNMPAHHISHHITHHHIHIHSSSLIASHFPHQNHQYSAHIIVCCVSIFRDGDQVCSTALWDQLLVQTSFCHTLSTSSSKPTRKICIRISSK